MMQRLRQFFSKNRSTSSNKSGGLSSWIGKHFFGINNTTMETNETIFSVVTQLSNTLSSLPLKLFDHYGERQDMGVADLIKYQPNPVMTTFEFINKLEVDRNKDGNGYALIERDMYLQPIALWPIPSEYVSVLQNTDDNSIWYQITGANQNMLVDSQQIIHVKHITGASRLTGISPIDVLKNALAFDKAVATFSLNEMSKTDSFKVTYAANLDDEKRENTIEDFKRFKNDNGGVLFQEPGVTVDQIKREFVSGDVINTEKITHTRIANAFNIPISFINNINNTVATNNEQIMTQFVQKTLTPIVRQYEQELTIKLLTQAQRKQGLYLKFNMNGLMRGDVQARTAFYQAMRRGGVFSTNTILGLEDMPLSKEPMAEKLFVSGDLYPIDMDPTQRKGVSSNAKEDQQAVLVNDPDKSDGS